MAESTLSLQYTDFLSEIGMGLKYGRTSGSWSANQTADVAYVLKQGLSQFYNPPALDPQQPPHRWNFLRTGGTIATVAGTYQYVLPDNFGVIEGKITFNPTQGYKAIDIVSEQRIRMLYQGGLLSGRPQEGSITRTAPATIVGTPPAADTYIGERFTLTLWPKPDAVYNLTYNYAVLPQMLSATNPYPLGGAMHSRTILESCLAIAETHIGDTAGFHRAAFREALVQSIAHDKASKSVEFIGNMNLHKDEIRLERVDYITVYGVIPS